MITDLARVVRKLKGFGNSDWTQQASLATLK